MTTIQAGMKMPSNAGSPLRGAFMVRAVVIAVYYADDQDDRATVAGDPDFPEIKTFAADVLTYGGRHRAFLPKVPVVVRRHGVNDYDGLCPLRETTKDLSTGAPPVLNRTDGEPGDPRNFDGDHVLVEFLENDPGQPIIRDVLPHPRAKYRLVRADGEQKRSRYHGVETSIDRDGNVVVDTTQANSGATDAAGDETPALDAAHGNVTVRVNHNAALTIQGVNADGADEKFSLTVKDGELRVRLTDGESLLVVDKDGAASLKLGNGAVHAAIFEHVQTWWDSVAFPAIQILFDAHIHPSGMGPTGPTPTPLAAIAEAVAMLLSAKSGKLTFPDG